tara:strand:+ start:117 stop:1061 length:945 start_codon:yes stop_codon:yes gene_type:complete
MSFQWTVATSQRLDAFLADQNPALSRARVQKMIAAGGVEVNGEEATKSSMKLKEGDSVFQSVEGEDVVEESIIQPKDLQLSVLYEDEECMVIEKPAGFAVHPAAGIPKEDATVLHGIAHLFEERGIPFASEAVLVHRLDKETTGCLLIAKNPETHQLLQKQFEHRDVSKHYLAIVAGQPDPPKAIIDSPIGRNLTDRTKMSVLRTSVSREAKTTYRTLQNAAGATLVQCELHTGRTHQIRVHLSSVGHPILGDVAYGSSSSTSLTKQHAIEGICLHAWKLTFLSPTKLQEIAVEAPLPVTFLSALKMFGLEVPS